MVRYSDLLGKLLLFPLSLNGCDSENAYEKIFKVIGLPKPSLISTSQDYLAKYHWVQNKFIDFILVEEEPGVYSEFRFFIVEISGTNRHLNECLSIEIENNKICRHVLKNSFLKVQTTVLKINEIREWKIK